MNTTYKYCVSPFKFAVAAATCIISLLLTAVQLYLQEWAATALFLIIALLFLAVAVINGSVITISPSGISRSFAFISLSRQSWSDIAEVGVIGTKVFNNKDSKRTGTRYIYFSNACLDDEGRFQLALKWPPKGMMYLQYTKERLESVQLLWEKKVESYNAGDVFF